MIDDSSNNIFQVASSYGALNEITISENSPTANRRTLSTTRAISEVISSYFTPDVLRSTDEFLGVVLASVPTNTIRLTSKSQQWTGTYMTTAGKRGTFYYYKVLIPELESRCLVLNDKIKQPPGALSVSQRINTMADVAMDAALLAGGTASRSVTPGTLVKVTFDDLQRMKGPKIVAVYEKAFDITYEGGAIGSAEKFRSSRPSCRATKGPPPPSSMLSSYSLIEGVTYYPPGSTAATDLFADVVANNPDMAWADGWAQKESLHSILKAESGGKVGIPNYTYESVYSDLQLRPDTWPKIWQMAKTDEPGTYKGRSTATGLGQLLTSNVKIFYPGGTTGIGKAGPEAEGFMRYIYSRYGDPDVAWDAYGKGGKGAEAYEYVNSRTGETQLKEFKEGY